MSGPNFILDKGYKCSGAITQYSPVKLSTDDTVITCAAGDLALGVCQDEISAADATAGRVADIRLMGLTRMVASAAITRSARVIAAGTGKIVTATAATAKQNQIGIATVSVTTNGDHIDVMLTPGVQVDIP